jgi:Ni/Fe-hydrogenase 1 B-type cytochrome subunit
VRILKELHQPLAIRIYHWVMAISVIVLTITGFHLSQPYPWLSVKMSAVRKIHFMFGFIALANLIAHISFYIITKTYNDILFRWRNLKDIPSFAKYFLFLSEPHPNFGKYNPGQRLLFCSWAVVLIIGGVAGLAAYFPHEAIPINKLYGGLPGIKWIKYLTAVFFAVTIPIHLYLVFSEDPAKLQAIFTGYVRKEKVPPPPEKK